MSDLFIAARRAEHDGSRHVVAAGTFIDGNVRVKAAAGGSGSLAAALIAGRLERELAEITARGKQ